MGADVLGWLLPDATPAERMELARVVTALRLLRDDGRGPRGASVTRVAPSWARARRALERVEHGARRGALEALLALHVAAMRHPDCFLDLGPRALDHASVWRVLLACGAPPAPPAPLETPAAVIARLLAAGAAC
jgi:hypothetical protein